MHPLYKQLSQNFNSYTLTVSAKKLRLKQSLLQISNSFVPAEIFSEYLINGVLLFFCYDWAVAANLG